MKKILCMVTLLLCLLPIAVQAYRSKELLSAVQKNNVEEVRLLLSGKCDANARNQYGYTALMTAVFYNNIDIVKLLLQAGADLDLCNSNNDTALIIASHNRNAIPIIQLLLARGARINIQNRWGNMAFMCAAKYANFKAARLLLQAGADLNLKDRQGDTVFMKIVKNEFSAEIVLLINNYTSLAEQLQKDTNEEQNASLRQAIEQDYSALVRPFITQIIENKELKDLVKQHGFIARMINKISVIPVDRTLRLLFFLPEAREDQQEMPWDRFPTELQTYLAQALEIEANNNY